MIDSEFATVAVSRDDNANGPRLKLEDLETGQAIFLEALELASFTQASEEDRLGWLQVGQYRPLDEHSDEA